MLTQDARGNGVRGAAGFLMALLFVTSLPAVAAAGGGVGVRFGYADVSDDIFTGSGDLGGTNLVGLQLQFNLGPMLSIEAAGAGIGLVIGLLQAACVLFLRSVMVGF